MKFQRTVLRGEQMGQQIGFPTLNFEVGDFGQQVQPGVYACWVEINGERKTGALYFGPKGSGKTVLELHVLDFEGEVYGESVSFDVGEFIRGPISFDSLDSLKKQITEDVEQIRAVI